MFLGFPCVCSPNKISIRSAAFTQRSRVKRGTQTDRCPGSINRNTGLIIVHISCIRCRLNMQVGILTVDTKEPVFFLHRVATNWTNSCWGKSTTTGESTWCRLNARVSTFYGLQSVRPGPRRRTFGLDGMSSLNWLKTCSTSISSIRRRRKLTVYHRNRPTFADRPISTVYLLAASDIELLERKSLQMLFRRPPYRYFRCGSRCPHHALLIFGVVFVCKVNVTWLCNGVHYWQIY